MLFSLVQTLVCVLLIQGGIYALHLTSMGSTAPASDQNSKKSDVNSMLNVLAAASQQHSTLQQQQQPQQRTGGGGSGSSSSGDAPKHSGSLTPDFLQLERERLMMLDLAKQKAAGSGHRGRSYITGRVHMTPTAEEEAAASEYGMVMQQGRRGSMYGSEVTHPTEQQEYETVGSYDGGGVNYQAAPRRRPVKYEYGREVTPDEMDLDAYVELEPEPEPDVDELLPDLDGYQYLDELLAEQQRSKAGWDAERPDWLAAYGDDGYQEHGHAAGARFPHTFQTLEELEANPPSALQELFEIEQADEAIKQQQQHQHQQLLLQQQLQQQQLQQQLQQQQQQLQRQLQQQQHQQYLAAQEQQQQKQQQQQQAANNIRLQQKWQRKRAQQQQQQQRQQQQQSQEQQQEQKPLKRNIFGVHPKQKHYYNSQQHSKLSLANSEATATKHIGKSSSMSSPASAANNAAMQSSSSLLRSGAAAAATSTKNGLKNQAANTKNGAVGYSSSASSSAEKTSGAAKTGSSTSAESLAKKRTKQQRQQQQQQKLQQQQQQKLQLQQQQKQQQQQQQQQQQLQQQQQQQQLLEKEQMLNSNHKRSGSVKAPPAYGGVSPFSHSMASQLMLRSARGQRQYDVPQIECPTAIDGMERFACPTPDVQGRYRCIDDHVLCDGFIDCPEGEDENRNSCMFYKTTKAHLDVLADALLRWARG